MEPNVEIVNMDLESGKILANSNMIGSVAQKLLANGMNASGLRTNATLRYDEWKLIDEAVIQMALTRLQGIKDLQSKGLVKPLSNGLGTTVFQYEKQSGMSAASLDMDAVTRTQGDKVVFSTGYLPMPIIHKEFYLTIRQLEASRNRGEPLDTTFAAAATRQVIEKAEYILFNGTSSFTYGGGVVYGLKDAPNRATASITYPWGDIDSSGGGTSERIGEKIIGDILEGIGALNAKKFFGPFQLYVGTKYGVGLENDFKTNSDRSIRERIEAINSISGITVADQCAEDDAFLVQMTPDVIQLVEGLALMPVEWDTQGGLVKEFKIITIMVPWIKSDYDGNCGVCHLHHT
jgi:uncharacterized linocin/CFP29 family protein